MRNTTTLKAAFTFVETIVSLLLIGVIIAGVLGVLSTGEAIWGTETTLISLQEQSRRAMAGMTHELRQSRPTDITVSGGGTRVDFLLNKSTNPIAYYLVSGQLLREHPANTLKLLADNITGINFSLTGSLMVISLSSAKQYKGRNYSLGVVEKIKIRNE